MTDILDFAPGNYWFLPGAEQYSAGVKAQEGFSIERVRFARPIPLAQAFEAIGRIITGSGRPPTALCALELRSPAPFSEAAFSAFSGIYRGKLEAWGLQSSGITPVARSNVCPKVAPPNEPSVHAFSFTAARDLQTTSFVIAGSCEAPEGKPNYRDHIIRYGDISPAGIQAKAEWVLDEMERRLAAFAAAWRMITATQIYTVHDFFPCVEPLMGPKGLLANGITWHLNMPPVVGLEFEMDCRRVFAESVVEL